MVGNFLMRQAAKEGEADRLTLVGWQLHERCMNGVPCLKLMNQLLGLRAQARFMLTISVRVFHANGRINATQRIERT